MDIDIEENRLMRSRTTNFTEDIQLKLRKGTEVKDHNSEMVNTIEDKEKIEVPRRQSASQSLVVNNNIHETRP